MGYNKTINSFYCIISRDTCSPAMPVPPAGLVVLDFLWNIARLSLADVQMGFWFRCCSSSSYRWRTLIVYMLTRVTLNGLSGSCAASVFLHTNSIRRTAVEVIGRAKRGWAAHWEMLFSILHFELMELPVTLVPNGLSVCTSGLRSRRNAWLS